MVAVASTIMATALGCSSSTPEGTVKDFISARLAANEVKAAKLTMEGDLSDFAGAEYSLSGTGVSVELSREQADSDNAVVMAHYVWGNQSADVPYACRRVKGKWKIDLAATQKLWMEETP